MTARILVIDDEPRYVRLMEANFKPMAFDVLKAYDGESGIELVVNQKSRSGDLGYHDAGNGWFCHLPADSRIFQCTDHRGHRKGR